VLDLATGPGFVGVEFANKGLEVVGTDITGEMLGHAKGLRGRRGVGMEFALAEASHQPFRDGTFDIAVSRLAFHHMRDPSLAVASMRRVLKTGGRMVIADLAVSEDDEVSEFHNSFEKFRDPSHVKSLKLSEWKRIFEENLLSLDRVSQSKVRLEVAEWAERAGFPKASLPELTRMLEKAPVKIRKALNVLQNGKLLSFLNTRAILVGRKQEKPKVQKAILVARRLIRK